MFIEHENVVANHDTVSQHEQYVMVSGVFTGAEEQKLSQRIFRIRFSESLFVGCDETIEAKRRLRWCVAKAGMLAFEQVMQRCPDQLSLRIRTVLGWVGSLFAPQLVFDHVANNRHVFTKADIGDDGRLSQFINEVDVKDVSWRSF